jgi:hypothetical protein
LFSGELPPDRDVIAIHASIPGFGLTAQRNNAPDPAFPQALASVVTSKAAIRGHFKTGHRDWPET